MSELIFKWAMVAAMIPIVASLWICFVMLLRKAFKDWK